MHIAKITVAGVHARAIYSKPVSKGIRGAKITIDYADAAWCDLVKNVVFTNGAETIGIFNAGSEVQLPPEVTATAGVEIRVGVFGVDAAGAIVIPTLWASLGVVRDATSTDFVEAAEVTPTALEQLLSLIGPMDQLGTEAKDSLVAAINEVIKLAGGDIDQEALAAALAAYLAENPIAETDPTVPDWAKQPTKPSYTAAEVGAVATVNGIAPDESGNVQITIPDSGQNADYVINQNGGGVLKIWAGTQSEYDALLVKDDDTVYLIDGATSSSGGDSSEEETTYTVTQTLTNVIADNSASSVTAGSAYSATLTPDTDYEIGEVAVHMGGVDITATAYSNGVISIANVTGSIVITATATAVSGGDDSGTETSATVYTFTNLVNKRIDDSGEVVDASGLMEDNFIPASDAAFAVLNGGSVVGLYTFRVYEYDESYTYLGTTTVANGAVGVPKPAVCQCEGVAYFKPYVWWSGITADDIDSLVFMPALKDEYLVEDGSLDSYGNVVTEANMYASDYMDVPDTSKAYYIGSNAITVKIAWYDENKTFISRNYILTGTIKVTPPENARYYRVSGNSTSCFSTLPVSGVS